jgi:DEAD/DEAH box helicase domain-containing protein
LLHLYSVGKWAIATLLRLKKQDRADIWQLFEEYHRAQYQLWFNTSLDADYQESSWRVELGDRLKSLPLIHNLLKILDKYKVIELGELWQELVSKKISLPVSFDPNYPIVLLDSLISLCAVARSANSRPWVNLRIQFWLRELRRMTATVEEIPQLVYGDDQTSEAKQKTLPVMHCRDCGSTGWGGLRKQTGERQIACDLRNFYIAFFAKNPLITYFFPSQEPKSDQQWTAWQLCTDCLTLNKLDAPHCFRCRGEHLIKVIEPNDLINQIVKDGQTKRESHHDCPFCGSKDGLVILGSRAASLASAAIGTLYTSHYNDDRKLITFSDSVQDAAHRAGFFEARTYRTTFRSALRQYLDQEGNGRSLGEIRTHFPAYWRSRLGNDADYVATFMPSDLEWLSEWEMLQQGRTVAPSLVKLIDQRLDWEVVAEVGFKTLLGGSLERTGSCAIGLDPTLLKNAIAQLQETLINEVGGLEKLTGNTLEQFLLGLIYHLRQRGGILHSQCESYIDSGGKTFLLQRPTFMPGFGPASLTPTYFSNCTLPRFETLIKSSKTSSWCEHWAFKLFSPYSVLINSQLDNLYHFVLTGLVKEGIFGVRSTQKGAKVWGIEQKSLLLFRVSHHLHCDRCGHTVTSPPEELSTWGGMPCLRPQCQGNYHLAESPKDNFYRTLYTKGNLVRIFAKEHTSLLEREVREEIENQFINGWRRCDPNLLSATSTLEMGIDIGDLSSVLLCSIPPAPANYQQRIGRAGRRDGNALVTAIANGVPHDLYFWADPLKMIAGGVTPPGFYLNASAILQRQLTAYCLDRWVSQGITMNDFPEKLGTVLDGVRSSNRASFPYSWVNFIEGNQQTLLQEFLDLFDSQITSTTQGQLQVFIEKGENDDGGLTWRILNRLLEVVEERNRLKNQVETLRRRLKDKETAAHSQHYEEEMAELKRERSGLMELIKNINEKNTLNFFTDEGLLPNYAFPEPGVTLRSIIWRKRNLEGKTSGEKYETTAFEYERPSAIAIRELAPSGVFYAEGKRVSIDQIDLNLSKIEEWRLCCNCSYATNTLHPTAQQSTCPRCGDIMWSDEGRKRKMVRLRQVMATTNARESRIVDDKDERTPKFFTQQMLVDFEPNSRENGYVIDDEDFPFGFEFLPRVTFRDINFGKSQLQAETFEVAGEAHARPGFRICRHCGKVQEDNGEGVHTFACRMRNQANEEDFVDVLYLFRQFERFAAVPTFNVRASVGIRAGYCSGAEITKSLFCWCILVLNILFKFFNWCAAT